MNKIYKLQCTDNTEKVTELTLGHLYEGIQSGELGYTILCNDNCCEQYYSKFRFEVLKELVPIVCDEDNETYICWKCKRVLSDHEWKYSNGCHNCGSELTTEIYDLDEMEG